VLCALLPKRKWKETRRSEDETRPYLFYLTASVVAVVASALVSYIFRCLMFVDLARAWTNSVECMPWLVMAGVTALLTAFLVDDRPSETQRRWYRWMEGGVQGAGTFVAAAIVHSWLPEDQQPPLPAVLIVTGLIGFILGATVPTWHRESPEASVLGDS
jgi:hypothetical protein